MGSSGAPIMFKKGCVLQTFLVMHPIFENLRGFFFISYQSGNTAAKQTPPLTKGRIRKAMSAFVCSFQVRPFFGGGSFVELLYRGMGGFFCVMHGWGSIPSSYLPFKRDVSISQKKGKKKKTFFLNVSCMQYSFPRVHEVFCLCFSSYGVFFFFTVERKKICG